ncbi:MAG: LysM peptidoglycan-binding domain-containing protein [Clostridiales bacterium]|nr:LysM peptidoglycan-binding domain-containing protein [Clostridiales bacterium]
MTNIQTVKIKRHNKRRKANRVTIALTFIFIISFLFLMMTLGNLNSYGDGEVEYIKVTVQSGDSLWKIADEVTPEHRDLRETMYKIIIHNNLDSEIVYPGQLLEVPRVY